MMDGHVVNSGPLGVGEAGRRLVRSWYCGHTNSTLYLLALLHLSLRLVTYNFVGRRRAAELLVQTTEDFLCYREVAKYHVLTHTVQSDFEDSHQQRKGAIVDSTNHVSRCVMAYGVLLCKYCGIRDIFR
jgi:hypothetical protein